MKIKALAALTSVIALLPIGCAQVQCNGFSGYQVEMHTRVIGLEVSASDTQGGTPMPDIKAGFASSSLRITPVNTNALYAAPTYDTFAASQTGWNPFGLNYDESSGTGPVATTTNGGSNIIPKSMMLIDSKKRSNFAPQ